MYQWSPARHTQTVPARPSLMINLELTDCQDPSVNGARFCSKLKPQLQSGYFIVDMQRKGHIGGESHGQPAIPGAMVGHCSCGSSPEFSPIPKLADASGWPSVNRLNGSQSRVTGSSQLPCFHAPAGTFVWGNMVDKSTWSQGPRDNLGASQSFSSRSGEQLRTQPARHSLPWHRMKPRGRTVIGKSGQGRNNSINSSRTTGSEQTDGREEM